MGQVDSVLVLCGLPLNLVYGIEGEGHLELGEVFAEARDETF